MCGIFGFYNFSLNNFKVNSKAFHILFKESHSRGKEASGFAAISNKDQIFCIKSDLDGRKLSKTEDYKKIIKALENEFILAAIGHSRIATHGSQLSHGNNQPVFSQDNEIFAVHNGIITNADVIWKASGKESPSPELDSISLIEYYRHLLIKYSKTQALYQIYNEIEGAASIAVLDTSDNSLVLATNTGSLYCLIHKKTNTLYFASEKIFFKPLLKLFKIPNDEVKHVIPKSAIIVENNTFHCADIGSYSCDNAPFIRRQPNQSIKIIDFSSPKLQSDAKSLYVIKNDIEKLKQHDFDYEKIYSLKRCTRCILPETTPFIKFDENGVCNYCHEQKPIKYKGIEELKKLVEKYRKTNGEPDCLAAFSGGKDSSYGLHFLKNELGLQPLAYTYDWGMITDIARRNQARILGKLGIEHIIVSADITKKRKHIRQNIRAWLKDPHPGMVTLFMEGDKQCEFYADRLKKKYDIKLMFFFRGNELEIDEFKTGHCGVKDADPGGVIHHLEAWKKLKLLTFYSLKYFQNPSYFNASFFDTSLAFYTTYIKKHHYVFLWHYIPWVESEILSTLKHSYNFELPKETLQTWRTDDGTSAFYNYIYYHVQGFTENDSFRSRQIRAGIMDRATALELVHKENKPRYEALRWYFDVVGLDGDMVLSKVDKMEKMY
ncbi:MAG: hypothetical protein PHT69_06085 [Bacteroidales bacterium]|nr:hypothetical protein [Bacteroidales bacterium]